MSHRSLLFRPTAVNAAGAFLLLTESIFVMRGLDPRIHLLREGWIAGSKSGNDERKDSAVKI
jgi:hypothetical protein